MKFLFLFLISFSTMASNWMPISKIQSQSNQAYQLESECLKSGEQCLDVDPSSLQFSSLEDHYLQSDVQECSDDEDCSAKLLALVCSDDSYEKIKNLDLLQVYCVKLAGKKLVIDNAALASYQAQQSAQAQMQAALAAAKKMRECGSGVVDVVLVRNAAKQLNTTQVKAMVSIYAAIKGLLETGSLASAKEEVQLIEPDGALVTEGDKVAVIAAIDSCLGN